jgi:hypothetical protein
VRAEILGGGFVMHPLPGNPNACELRYVAHSDLKGSIPSSITKGISVKQPLVVAGINQVLEKARAADNFKSLDVAYIQNVLKAKADEENAKNK